jgi:lipopolysaccharide export system protein LptC
LTADLTLRDGAERRRSRLVRVGRLRRALPLVAGAVLALVAAQIAWRTVVGLTVPAHPANESTLRMDNPSFSGSGRDGSRYVLTAKSGQRDLKNDELILLDNPTVTITPTGAAGTRTTARRGMFRENDLTLRLEGDVQGQRGNGDRFVAQDVTINTSTGEVSGQGLHGTGSTGAVQANSYAVQDSGQRVVLKGGVRSRLNIR